MLRLVPRPGPRARPLPRRLWDAFVQMGRQGERRSFVCTEYRAPGPSRFVPGPALVGPASPGPPASPATPTRPSARRGRPLLRCRSRRAAPGARGPLNCSQNGWRLDQLICKTGVNHLIRGPHAGREPRHLLCSEVAAPAACLSGEMEIRQRTKPPRGQAAPSAALGWVAGAGPDLTTGLHRAAQ